MSEPKAKVLLLDDSATVRKVVSIRLAAAGYAAKVAGDLTEFAAALGEVKPDVVLLDVMMPELFGDDLVTYVQSRAGAGTRVLFLSGLEESKLAELVQASGADGYICKTDGFKDLAPRLDDFFARLAETKGP